MEQKKDLEKGRKSAMRKLISLWLFVHLSILTIHFTLGPNMSFQSVIDGIISILIIGLYLLVIVVINLIVISKGKSEFNLDYVVKKNLLKKLEVARKDYSEISNNLEKIDKNLMQIDDWIGLANYGNSRLEIEQSLIKKIEDAKKKMFELEDKVQIIKKMKYPTFWAYLLSFKWF